VLYHVLIIEVMYWRDN